jgi:geranylgeranyl diphosphate synthase type I
MATDPTVDELRESVDAELRSIVTSRDMPLYHMMAYHMGLSDKDGRADRPQFRERTHGILCLLACAAAGGDPVEARPAAAAVELVENFCQIHEDVQGGLPERNNQDAVWWVWGPAQAINAGDGMHALARLALFRLLEGSVSKESTFRAVQLFDEASLRACEGRFLDLEAQEHINLSVDAYLKMAAMKMGSLVSCSMMAGALVAAADEAVYEALDTCGTSLGIAMQIKSDLRDMWGDGSEGHVPSHEVMNKKKQLPVVYAMEKASVSEKRKLGEIYFKRVLDAEDAVRLREVIVQIGARAECETLFKEHHANATTALDVPGLSTEGRAAIQQFINAILE